MSDYSSGRDLGVHRNFWRGGAKFKLLEGGLTRVP